MNNKPLDLQFHAFPALNEFSKLVSGVNDAPSVQVQYFHSYLSEIETRFIIEETNYFDRDYLDEFSAFYGVGARGYPNICRRLHFFGEGVEKNDFLKALTDEETAIGLLNTKYFGFSVLRPIPSAPLGRTVVTLYPKTAKQRIADPTREYKAHLVNIELRVTGLAWQQQDQGVSACATIGLWSMLHASAFDERHSIPTTAIITRAAHKHLSFGSRVFPSHSLKVEQICEAIKELGLSPNIINGDKDLPTSSQEHPFFFSKSRFSSSIAALVRSAYPCMIIGIVDRAGGGGHTNVCLGFKEKPIPANPTPGVTFIEQDLDYIYVHDDNIGPGVKFQIFTKEFEFSDGKGGKVKKEYVVLKPFKPDPNVKSVTDHYGELVPSRILFAVEDDLRTNPVALAEKAKDYAQAIHQFRNAEAQKNGKPEPATFVGIRFLRSSKYLGVELSKRLGGLPEVIRDVRLMIQEKVSPLSLYVSVIRIGDSNGHVADILLDTTDGDQNIPIFCTIVYDPVYKTYFDYITAADQKLTGLVIAAYKI